MADLAGTAQEFTIGQLCAEFGLSAPTVTKRLRLIEPLHDGARPKRYRMQDAAPAILQVSRETLDPAQEIARVNRARAIKVELENAKTRGEVLLVEEVTDRIESLATEIVSTLRALPAEMKRSNPALTSQDLDLVRAAVARVCNRAAALSVG